MRLCPLCGREVDRAFCDVHDVPTVPVDFLESRPPPRLEAGIVLGGRYRLDARLGQGAMGTVYRATQLDLGREVALKVLAERRVSTLHGLRRFYVEAEVLKRLEHPNIVRLFDLGVDDPTRALFLVIELVRGRSLAALLRAPAPLDPRRAAHLALQLADALAFAHPRGVVHRDLKPDNVLLGTFGDSTEHVKVLDFGIAKLVDDGGLLLTAPGLPIGTPLYMSPEQATGAATGPASDVYALGCILHELLLGAPPHLGDTLAEVLAAKRAGPPPLDGLATRVHDPELRARLATLIAHMLDPRPAARASLDEVVAGLGAVVGRASPAERAEPSGAGGLETTDPETSDPTATRPEAGDRARPGPSVGAPSSAAIDERRRHLLAMATLPPEPGSASTATAATVVAGPSEAVSAITTPRPSVAPATGSSLAPTLASSPVPASSPAPTSGPSPPSPPARPPPLPSPTHPVRGLGGLTRSAALGLAGALAIVTFGVVIAVRGFLAMTAPGPSAPIPAAAAQAAPSTAEEAPAATPRTTAPEALSIDTRPEGATVLIDGERVGVAPIQVTRPRSGAVVRAVMTGHAPVERVIDARVGAALELVLAPPAHPPPTQPAQPAQVPQRRRRPNIEAW